MSNPAPVRNAPEFGPDNTAAMSHGAYSPRTVEALAAAIAQSVVDAVPYTGRDRFAFALRAYSHAEARAELIRRHLDQHGVLNNRNTPRTSLLVMLAAAERAAHRGRQELGLSPESAARIAAMFRTGGVHLLSPAERREVLR